MDKNIEQIISFLCLIIINGSILYYLMYIEQDKCKCLIDWRHKYVKFYCVFIIAINFFVLIVKDSLPIPIKAILIGFIIIAGLIFYYSLLTYIHQLDKDNCVCATKDLKDLHTILYYFGYLFYIQLALVVLLIISSISLSLSINEKEMKKILNKSKKMKSVSKK